LDIRVVWLLRLIAIKGKCVAFAYFCGFLNRYCWVSGQTSSTPRFANSSAAFCVASSFPMLCQRLG
jgi:hypothetical protein